MRSNGEAARKSPLPRDRPPKKFLIIGNMNAVSYTEVFPLIRGNEIWLGATGNEMTATLMTDLTVEDICRGFVYNELEGKGRFGWGGRLVIQPECQRNYINRAKGNR